MSRYAPRENKDWCQYFRFGVSSATFGYLDKFVWRRITGWLRKRHKGITWKALYRRFLTSFPSPLASSACSSSRMASCAASSSSEPGAPQDGALEDGSSEEEAMEETASGSAGSERLSTSALRSSSHDQDSPCGAPSPSASPASARPLASGHLLR